MLSLARHKLDFIIGLFLLAAAFGVVFIALRTADITEVSSSEGYQLRLKFDNIGTIAERSPVKTSGVRVGRVKAIRYNADEFRAEVDIIIEQQYHFPVDSIFSIVSSNLLGGQYISIDIGGSEENFQPNEVIEGNSAFVLEELISKFLFDRAGE